MQRPICCHSLSLLRKGNRFLLAFCWISGLVFGMAVYRSHISVFSPAIRQTVVCGIPQNALPWLQLLPVILSGVAVFLSANVMLFAVCFSKAALFGLASIAVLHHFACSGWLIHLLFLFLDIAGAPVLYLYWIRSLEKTGHSIRSWVCFFLVVGIFLGIWYTDICIITPILAGLIDF